MADSQKNRVFSYLFANRHNPKTGTVAPSTVTNSDIQDAIVLLAQEEGLSLSPSNPANFLKDYLRSKKRNSQWPAELAAAGYTARQLYGQGRVFEFVPYQVGQTEPFPDEFSLPPDALIHQIESVSMPSAARALGRKDESWLIQVCVHQRVLQTHFALFSQLDATDLFHLQNSLKGAPEIDAVFLLTFRSDAGAKKAIITFEAKRDEPILPDQIREQVALMAWQTQKRAGLNDIDFIIPVAGNTTIRDKKRVVAIFEMAPITVGDALSAYKSKTSHDLPLTISNVVGYSFHPTVIGV